MGSANNWLLDTRAAGVRRVRATGLTPPNEGAGGVGDGMG